MKNKTVLIVDGNNLLYKFFYSGADVFKRTSNHGDISILYQFPKYLMDIYEKFNRPELIVVAWDSKKSEHRLNIWPEYKKRKTKTDIDLKLIFDQRDILITLLNNLGNIHQCVIDNYEGDDLIYLAVRKWQKTHKVVIISSDKDFAQLINNQVSQYYHNTKRILDISNFKSIWGIKPSQMVDYLSIVGDTSDNIPGYPGIGEKTAQNIFNEFDTLEAYLETNPKKIDMALMGQVLYRNRQLIDLKLHWLLHNRGKYPYYHIFKKSVPSQQFFTKFCSFYNIKHFLSSQFRNTFKV